MGIDIYQNYSQFYRGTQPLKTYGNGKNQKDTLVKYEFNTTDAHGNKVMDQMTREETLRAIKDISSQYGDNVMVEFSGDGMAKLVESRKGNVVTLSEEEAAARQAEVDSQVVQLEGTYRKVEGDAGIPDNDFHTILKENDPELARQVEELNSRIINHKPGDPSNAEAFKTLMKKAMDVVAKAGEKEADAVEESKNVSGAKLSERAQKLLEKLRKTYGNMDFMVLTPGADAKALLVGGTKEISVLFSVEELEKMASSEKYEKEYMDRIQGALRMSEDINKKFGFESAFGKDGGAVTKIGISFNSDGTTSIFAELEKSGASQRERIEKTQEERRAQKKENAKKAAADEQKERLERNADQDVKRTTVQADSVEELLEKIRKVDWNIV